MKKFTVLLAIFLVFGMASQVSALSFGDEFFVGTITPGGGKPDEEATQVNHLITLAPGGTDTYMMDDYVRSTNDFGVMPSIDLDTVDDGNKQDNSNTSFDATGYTYVIGKYDHDNAGVAVWYNAIGFDGLVELPSTWFVMEEGAWVDTGQYGLSHSVGMGATSVPEPSTVLLLGIGLVGLAGIGRKRLKN